ncbi:uncharacterized protein LOC117645056 [Thrips palmi]|uniref:Uncharacterized protein LOC117645056 n=1 Tax=Thrips palmi TaxID=161013 RepID=A0A6P8YLQ9_THRPL|nr:uncharacterized protein LOC117645056 [Thrips palmi]XP_034240844.1 uncharacterized protein LOC117645056 [Thrips palmi]
MDGLRQVKVDNWAAFFLQKLQALYTRGDFTDLTLQFHTNECIKVHRLVLNTCTEYFETLIKQNNVTDHMRLPPTFQSDVVVPIINFMYSGRLEFRPELHQRLYNTARILNMSILTKLLDTHGGPVNKPVSPKQKLLTLPVNTSSGSVPCSPAINSRTNFNNEGSDFVPGKKLPIWKKRTVPSSSFSLNVTPRPIVEEPAKPTRFEWPEDGDSDSAPLLYSSTFDDISYDSVPIVKSINSIVQSALPPSPSQPLVQLPQERVMPAATFESVYQSANLKRDTSSRPHGSQVDGSTPKKPKVDIDDVKDFVQAQEVRKSLITNDNEQENEDLDDFLPVADNDAEDFEDDAEEGINDRLGAFQSQSASTTPSSKNSTPKPILKLQGNESPEVLKESTPSKKVRFHLEPQVRALVPVSALQDAQNCLVSGNSESQVAGDNLSMEAINNEPAVSTGTATGVSSVVASTAPAGTVPLSNAILTGSSIVKKDEEIAGSTFEIRAPVKKTSDGTGTAPKSPTAANHAKIIAEVLKKYPDLVKNNKNIRLKIIQKDGSPAVSVEKPGVPGDSKPKVSYMVVKTDQSVKSRGFEQNNKLSGVFNRTGPWLCSTCDPESPILFDTYYNYRKHLREVHNEKVDCRICEHCGHHANKRNLLLYHLYKVHGIPPPPSCKFPKCDQCNHISLSEVLLAKHKNTHSNVNKEYQCSMCLAYFKSHTTLQNHLENSQRCNPRRKTFKCPVCSKDFQLQVDVKSHIRTDHQNLKLLEDMEQPTMKMEESLEMPHALSQDMNQHQESLEQQLQQQQQQASLEQALQHTHDPQDPLSQQVLQAPASMEVSSDVHSQAGLNAQPQTTYILPPGVTILTDNQGTLMQSTEAEALSNVASGIAASLGVADSMVVGDQGQHQTFIVVDKNSLIQIPGPPGNPGQVHEYIVPDMMSNDMSQSVGVYTPSHLSQLVQYTTAGGLQQPVAVSTSDQGLMTITTVNANGSIVNHTVPQQGNNPIMETAMMQIPQGHIQDHSGGEITMILTDHAYSEGIVRENGGVMQATSVPVSMNMVPTSAVVSVVSAVPNMATTVPTSSMSDDGMVITPVVGPNIQTTMAPSSMADEMVITAISGIPSHKSDDGSDVPNNSTVSQGLLPDQQVAGQTTQKMAELASDWDDVDESEDSAALSRSTEDVSEDSALPSRPSILLKNELDSEDIPDNLPLKIT